MKKILTLAAALFTFGLFAETETETIEIQNDNSFNSVIGFWCENNSSKRTGGKIFKGPEGRTGSCMRITCTPTGSTNLFSRALIPFEHAADTIKCSIWVKGKGTFSIGFYLYAAKGRGYIGNSPFQKVTVDSKEYKKYDFVFPCAKWNPKAKTARISIIVNKEADLYFDDFTGVKESVIK